MATLGLKEMGKFLWEGMEKVFPFWLSQFSFAKLRQPTGLPYSLLPQRNFPLSFKLKVAIADFFWKMQTKTWYRNSSDRTVFGTRKKQLLCLYWHVQWAIYHKYSHLNYHRGYLFLLRFEKKLTFFDFRQKFKEKYFMQILNAEKV